jgi:hypothetical protein
MADHLALDLFAAHYARCSVSTDEGFFHQHKHRETSDEFEPPGVHPPKLNPEAKVNNMKLYTKDDLLKVSRFIRDDLIPNLKSEDATEGMQTANLMAELDDFLKMMKEALVDDDLLVNTRIERAFLELLEFEDNMPPSMFKKVSAVVNAWATQLQHPVEIVAPNIWGEDGPMVGIIRVKSWKKKSEEDRMTTQLAPLNLEESYSKWKLADTFAANPDKAYAFGNRGILPGK